MIDFNGPCVQLATRAANTVPHKFRRECEKPGCSGIRVRATALAFLAGRLWTGEPGRVGHGSSILPRPTEVCFTHKGDAMGTRNLIEVKCGGRICVAQYGQWDGYPTGQGKDIARFLRSGYDKRNMTDSLLACRFLRDTDKPVIEAANKLNGDEWKRFIPQLCRDAGAFILWQVYGTRRNGLVLDDDSDFKKDTVFCEFHWLIDFDAETVSMNGETPVPFAEFTEEWCVNREKQDSESE